MIVDRKINKKYRNKSYFREGGIIRNNKLKLNKIICTLLILLLITTIFQTSTVAYPQKSNNKNNGGLDTHNNNKLIIKQNSKLRNILENIRESLKHKFDTILLFSELLKNKEGDRGYLDNVLQITALVGEYKQGDSSLVFYTNYKGTQKETKLKLLRETNIDVDGDNKDDLGVKYTILPGIVSPLALSINFKLKIRQLNGFTDLEEEAYFEAYAELFFRGLLMKNLSGDFLRFGFESLEDEKIPESCELIYKFVPHMFSIRKKHEHRFLIDTDNSVKSKSKLNLVFGFVETNDESVTSEILSKVVYDPIVKSEILIKRTKKGREREIEYQRMTSSDAPVDMYVAHIEGENKTYAYVKNIPKHVMLSSKLGRKGFIKFDTFNEPAGEIGLCDDFDNPKNRLFFKNMFESASMEWERELLLLLKKGEVNVSIYTEGEGVSFNLHMEGSDGGTADLSLEPEDNIIDCNMKLDISESYFRVYRNELNVLMSFNVIVKNESYASWISKLQGSLNLKRLNDGPFEIFFDDLFDGDIEIFLSGKSFEMSDVYISCYSPKIGGNLSVEMDYLLKEKQGDVSFNVDITKAENKITGSCFFNVTNGVRIENLILRFNGTEFYSKDVIEITGDFYDEYSFYLDITVEWHVYDDWGYILIKSGSVAEFDFNSIHTNESGVIVGTVSGNIKFDVVDEDFNLSWGEIDGDTYYSIGGSSIISLSNFHLWLKDKLDVFIPEISISENGKITVAETENGNISISIGGSNEIHLDTFQFEINNTYGEINGQFLFNTDNSYVYINWTKGDLTSLSVDGSAEFSINNFRLIYGENISIEVSKVITGGIHCAEDRTGNFSISVDDTYKDIDISLHLNQKNTNFTLSGDIDIDITGVTNGILWINWNLNNNTKNVSIDGNLFRDHNMEISITDFVFIMNNFTFTADSIYFDRKVYLNWNETGLHLESETTIETGDIFFSFNAGSNSISTANAEIIIEGSVSFEFKPWNDGYMFCIESPGFTLDGWLYINYNEYSAEISIWWKIIGKFCFGLDLG